MALLYKNIFREGSNGEGGALLVKEDRVSMLSPVGGKLVFSSGLKELERGTFVNQFQ